MNTPRTEQQAAGTGGFTSYELRRLPSAALYELTQGADLALASRAQDVLTRREDFARESMD